MSVQVDTVWCQIENPFENNMQPLHRKQNKYPLVVPGKQKLCMFLYYLGSRTVSLLRSSGSVRINRIPFLLTWIQFTLVPLLEKVLESRTGSPILCKHQGASTSRRWPVVVWWAADYRQLIKMGLAGDSHPFKPLRWTLVTLSHLWGKTTTTRTRGKRPRTVLILLERGWYIAMKKTWWASLCRPRGELNCFRKFYWRWCYVDSRPLTCIYSFILLSRMSFPCTESAARPHL